MNKCPRCENENLKEGQNFCQICGVNLKSKERTAQEVPVQEQLAYEISNSSETINQVRKEYCLETIDGGDVTLISQSESRIIMLKALLGNDINIFVNEQGQNRYEVEVADSRKRIKLLNINLVRLSKYRYCLINYQPF